MIPIFLSSDNNYAPYLSVVIKSVCENTNNNLNFYIIDGGISDIFKAKIIEMVSQYNASTIEFINPESQNIFNKCETRNHISKAAFLRLLIPYLKPKIDKAVYLDVDLIVNIDIGELYNQDIGDYILGAVYEECNEKYHSITSKKNLDIDMKHRYFNSGVLLINCKKWRENNITQVLKDTYVEYKEKMIFHDQDLLNKYFSTNNYFPLDKKFNYLVNDEQAETQNIIIHYDGPMKPWQFLPDLKTDAINYKDIWWKFAQKTNCFEIIKEKCIYKDLISLRIARATKAKQMLNTLKIEQKFEQANKI